MSDWPRLDYQADQGTIDSLHLLSQLVGKLPVRLHPWVNHGWHVALRMTPRGAMTRPLPGNGQHFTVELDFLDGAIRVACDSGRTGQVDAAGITIAAVHRRLGDLLQELRLPAPLHGGPNELPDPVPFAQDDRPRAWDPDAARRLLGAFLRADRAFTAFRALYRGKSSPSHLFWGSFDLAVTRFSGRAAPTHPGGVPHLADRVTREAYSHEVVSAGFWPGNGGFGEAAFYAYSYPVPPGLDSSQVQPSEAGWNADLGEFILPYEAVRTAPDPAAALHAFLHSTFEAAAQRLQWPEELASTGPAAIGHPPTG